MKTRIYLRVAKAKQGVMVKADKKPNPSPLSSGSYTTPYPTVRIALDIEIPDKEFDASRILLEAKIKETKPCVEIKQVEEKQ